MFEVMIMCRTRRYEIITQELVMCAWLIYAQAQVLIWVCRVFKSLDLDPANAPQVITRTSLMSDAAAEDVL